MKGQTSEKKKRPNEGKNRLPIALPEAKMIRLKSKHPQKEKLKGGAVGTTGKRGY